MRFKSENLIYLARVVIKTRRAVKLDANVIS